MAYQLRILGVGNAKSISVIRWARRLQERGHHVSIISSKFSTNPGELDGIPVYDVNKLSLATRTPGLRGRAIPGAIGKLADSLGYDIAHAHYTLPYGWWAGLAGLHPLVMSPWGTDILIDSKKEPGRSRVRAALEAADAYVINSEANRAATLEFGVSEEKMRKIIWYAEPHRFSPGNRDPKVLEELGFPPDSLLILSLRNFRPDTNLDVIVRAFAQVHAREPRARLLLGARGGPLRDQVEAVIDELGVRDALQIKFISQEDLPRYVASGDVLVQMTNSDSTPGSLLEAMGSGLPAICGNAASVEEWIPNGEGGIVVPARDADSLADALVQLLQDPELRKRYGDRNRRTIEEVIGDPGEMLERFYLEVLGR
jgi:glycosyltransferase involved in cell wall biosynthesis